MEKIVIKGRGAFPGKAEGYALVCPHSITGWNGINPKTGVIKDYANENKGKSIKNTILVMPCSKGSNGWSCYFGASRVAHANPSGWIFSDIDSSAGVASAALRIPTVVDFSKEENPCKLIKNGDYIKIDGDNGIVEIFKNTNIKSNVVEHNNTIYVGGQMPDNCEKPWEMSFKDQARAVFGSIDAKLKTNGSCIENTVMNYINVTDMAHLSEMNEVYLEFFKNEDKPTRITVATKELKDGVLISASAVAAKNSQDKKTWDTQNKPFLSPISKTSTIHNGLIRLNGQVSMNPVTGDIERESFEIQARRVLGNIKLLLEQQGCTMENVVHVNTKISCDEYFWKYVEIYSEFFPDTNFVPARVACTSEMWENMDLEVSVVAVQNKEDKKVWRSLKYKGLSTQGYPSAVIVGRDVFLSGIISNDPHTGDSQLGDLETELRNCFRNLRLNMEELNLSLENVLMLDIYITEMEHYDVVDKVVKEMFGEDKIPAVSVVGTKEVFGGLKVEFGAFAGIK